MKRMLIPVLALTAGLIGCNSTMESISKFAAKHRVEESLSSEEAGWPIMVKFPNASTKVPRHYAYENPQLIIKLQDMYLGKPLSELSAYKAKDKKSAEEMIRVGGYLSAMNTRTDSRMNPLNCFDGAQQASKALDFAADTQWASVWSKNLCRDFQLQGVTASKFTDLRQATPGAITLLTSDLLYRLRQLGAIDYFRVYESLDNEGVTPAYSTTFTVDPFDRVVAFNVTERFPFSMTFLNDYESELQSLFKQKNIESRKVSLTPTGRGTIPVQSTFMLRKSIGSNVSSKFTSENALQVASYYVRLGCDMKRRDYCYVSFNQDAQLYLGQVSKKIWDTDLSKFASNTPTVEAYFQENFITPWLQGKLAARYYE